MCNYNLINIGKIMKGLCTLKSGLFGCNYAFITLFSLEVIAH